MMTVVIVRDDRVHRKRNRVDFSNEHAFSRRRCATRLWLCSFRPCCYWYTNSSMCCTRFGSTPRRYRPSDRWTTSSTLRRTTGCITVRNAKARAVSGGKQQGGGLAAALKRIRKYVSTIGTHRYSSAARSHVHSHTISRGSPEPGHGPRVFHSGDGRPSVSD